MVEAKDLNIKKKSKSQFAQSMRFYSVTDKLVLLLMSFILLFFLVIVTYPLIYALISSFSMGLLPINLIPMATTLAGYKACLEYPLIWTGFRNSIIYTVLGTAIALFVTICCAYPLSINIRIRRPFLIFCMFTMYFSGGLIPTFLWIKNLGLFNTIWSILLPGSLSIYNMLIMRTYFSTQIPKELKESAELDGASELTYLIQIALPLSGAVIAVIALYYATGIWNSYFHAMIYLQDREKMPLANVLRTILVLSDTYGIGDIPADSMTAALMEERREVMKYCVIVIATVPMMIVYPFIQKYFVTGVMIGAIKG